MKITRLRITNYRGVREADIPVGAGGLIAKGACETGKTSVLSAISAALAAQGVSPSDIHLGADKAEIIVDVDALRVRRGITKSGTSLAVKNSDGFTLDSPQTRLREMLGSSGIDPISFFMAKPAERRQIILDTTPVTVTTEDVARWIPGEAEPDAVVSLEGHGLEALGRLRKHYYDLRTEANKAAKTAAEEAARADEAAAALAPNRADDLDATAIEDESERARAALLDVEARQKAAAKAKAASGEAMARIAGLRAQAAESAAAAEDARPGAPLLEAADRDLQACAARVSQLRHDLELAEREEALAQRKVAELNKELVDADRHQQRADDSTRRADELEAALASAAPDVPADEVTATAEAYNAAVLDLARLDSARAERDARQEAEARATASQDACARADELDRIVTTLTDDAPRELAARGNLIPGFDVETMSLDGVPLDSLSGGQKLEFAVKLAKRANPEAKILICDGLERLDPKRMKAFVEMATEGDWQLLASRVEAGEIQFEAIEP